MSSLSGKAIAVTGAGSGIGRATAELLASRGALLSIADVNAQGLEQTLNSLKGKGHMSFTLDVQNSSAVNTWIKETVNRLGRLDGAANIAGVLRENKLAETTDEDWDFVMRVNCSGVFYCMRAELNQMLANGGGSIVNMTSVAGFIGLELDGAYTASKHAVIGLTKTAAREYGTHKIRVNAVAPGVVRTAIYDFTSDEDEYSVQAQALKRSADPIEIATVVAFLLSDEASYVTGSTYKVDAGWTC